MLLTWSMGFDMIEAWNTPNAQVVMSLCASWTALTISAGPASLLSPSNYS
jgi:hypothetical protein